MKLFMLLEEKMEPVPAGITVEQVFDDNLLVIAKNGRDVLGKHVLLSGEVDDFKDWLRPFDGVWVSVGSTPMEQKFEVCHVVD
jgi:hypothetical protein